VLIGVVSLGGWHCSDLKPSNLLVDEWNNIKVCDFGLSAVKPMGEKLKDKDSIPGTPLWMAPEVMMGRPLDEKSDVYSFGIVLWEIGMMPNLTKPHATDSLTNLID
jgi:serine/threonine protein kinase